MSDFPELTDAEIDELLERFDLTEPRLQRRIIADFVAKAAVSDDLRRQCDELRRMLQKALDSLVCAVDAGGDPVSHILCCEIRKTLANCK